MKLMHKEQVQTIFGGSADAYVSSQVHAKGDSLARLLELLTPQPDWRVLDVATGGGHTAFTLAPHVRQVVATDITPEMLVNTARGRGRTRLEQCGHTNSGR
ncbi:MAG: hypothetical protein M5U34_20985 [Chloroflexi bacterium]|nr:hypothetical protein [Chloroflexota bacterium]